MLKTFSKKENIHPKPKPKTYLLVPRGSGNSKILKKLILQKEKKKNVKNIVGILERSLKSRDRRSYGNGTYDLSRKYESTGRHVSATVWGSRAHDGIRGAFGRLVRRGISRGAGDQQRRRDQHKDW